MGVHSLSPSSSFESLSTPSSTLYFNSNNYGRINRKPSFRSMAGSGPTQRSPLFFCDSVSDDEPHYFLDSCFLCKTPLHVGDDIYMYRGDTPFCSEECRQQQIEMDEEAAAKGKNKRKMSEKNLKSKTSKSYDNHFRAAEAVAAG